MSTRKEIKDEIAKLEKQKSALMRGGDKNEARMVMKEIRKYKRKLKRMGNPNKQKPDKWI